MARQSCMTLALLLAISWDPPASAQQQAGMIRGPEILGTLALPVRAERFSESLRRAREDASNSPVLRNLVKGARSLSVLQQLSFVQNAVNTKIRWVSDTTEWGQHDYWASASQTLARGEGDSEDRAIVKLQALRALGFNNSDLFLTLARDRVGGPVTVVVVRSAGHNYVLDDTGGPPFLVEQRRFEFQPVLSFGMYGAWIHVRPTTIASAKTDSSMVGRR